MTRDPRAGDRLAQRRYRARQPSKARQRDWNLCPSNSVGTASDWTGVSSLEAVMDTVLFTDHGILVFVITMSAIALMLSVLGLATTEQTRSDIRHQLKGLP
jgi:hypothetical protein